MKLDFIGNVFLRRGIDYCFVGLKCKKYKARLFIEFGIVLDVLSIFLAV